MAGVLLTGCGANSSEPVSAPASEPASTEAATQTDEQEPEEVISELAAELTPEDYAAMGMQTYETVEELTAAVKYKVLTLDTTDEAYKAYTPEEISLENGAAVIRYVTDTEPRQVIILTSGNYENVSLDDRESIADVVMGDQIVSLAQDDELQQKSAWWITNDDFTYTIDTLNIENADFKDLLESLAK